VPDTLLKELARLIDAACKRKKWSRNQLADFAGIGRGHLSEILNGKTSPTLRTLKRISDALEVEMRDLIPMSGK